MRQFRTRSTIAGLFGAVILISAATMPVMAETLRGALTKAYNNSNLLEQNRALLRAQDENVAQTLAGLKPQISANARVAHSDQATGGFGGGGGTLSATLALQLQMLLYDAGATALGVEAAKETVLAARQQLITLEQQVLLAAAQAYASVKRDRDVVELRRRNFRLITQELRAARDRFDVGEVTRTDVAQAEARLAQARGDVAQSEGDLRISEQQYKLAIGVAPPALANLALPKLPKNLDSAHSIAAREQPSIRQIQHEIKANELNVARTRASTKPNITFDANVGHSRLNDNNSSIGLTMNVPIYQGGQLRSLTRAAIAQVHASKSQLSQQILVTQQRVEDSWTNFAVAQALVRSNDQQIRAAQVALEGVREEAKLGARTTLDVLDAEQDVQDALTNRVVAQTNAFLAGYQLVQSLGMLTVDGLKLPVERYDPSEYYNAVKSAPVPVTKQGKKLERILKRYQKN